jgi:hypothetical protein
MTFWILKNELNWDDFIMTQHSCLTHTFWIGVLIAILILFGFHGCQSANLLPCVIRAKPDRNVAVRVGPGNDRAIRFYLPNDENFLVIGHATAADDTYWWKIESNDIAQAWVAQSDVTSIGNCEAVGNAAAPPIIIRTPQAIPTSPPVASGTVPPPPSLPPNGGPTYTPTEPALNLPTLTASYTRTASPGDSPSP